MRENSKISLTKNEVNNSLTVMRITALWAFSESTFGGILHALTIPLRGLFIASAAVLFISLIALSAKSSKEIFKSTIIVILIKAIVSPHSPLTAYLAVSLQGLLGVLFFSTKKFYKLSALLLGLSVLLFSGVQKIIVLTILFGNTLWESLDLFIKQISIELLNINNHVINYGYLLISGYVLLHLIAGFFIGLYAGRLPEKLNDYKSIILTNTNNTNGEEIPKRNKQKKKSWFQRPTGLFVVFLSFAIIILSYFSPELERNVTLSVVIMLFRSLVITFIWYMILAPVAKKLFQKFVASRESQYSEDLEEIISMFPQFRVIVNYCWTLSKTKKGIKRIRYFLLTSFYHLLLSK
jgi:hypothetical protein